jgi:hypothetical protein
MHPLLFLLGISHASSSTNYTLLAQTYSRYAAIAQCNEWATKYAVVPFYDNGTLASNVTAVALWPLLSCEMKVRHPYWDSNPRFCYT